MTNTTPSPWKRNGIQCKWPAARLVGPNVTEEQARDYIWRTDHALQNPGFCCNDQDFTDALCEWLGYPPPLWRHERPNPEWLNAYAKWQTIVERRGQIPLQYLESEWVATFYADGPHGPVHPNGEIRLAVNFGKWPTIEGVEGELTTITEAFPWLTFILALWDRDDYPLDTDGLSPDFAWLVEGGTYRRIPATKATFANVPIPRVTPFEIFVNHRNETSWRIDQLQEMWNHRLNPEETPA